MGMTGKQKAGVFFLFPLTSWDGGLNTSDSPLSVGDQECTVLENLVISKKGVLKRRSGLRRMNSEETVDDIEGLGFEYGDPNNPSGVNTDPNGRLQS